MFEEFLPNPISTVSVYWR